jgi:uncharacterized protein with LGFP repeats
LLLGAGFAVGSTADASAPIDAKYNEPGMAALLGAPFGSERNACKGNRPAGRVRSYANGNIYWSRATGAHEVHGAILAKYLGFAGPCGAARFPTTDQTSGPVSGEQRSTFQKATIYWTSALQAHMVRGPILAKYIALGEETGFLGLPISDDLASSGTSGKVTQFQNGNIYNARRIGAHFVRGPILTKYIAANEFRGPDGFPIGDEISLGSLGIAQEFQRANIYSSGAVGTHEVRGAILKKYLAMGGVFSWGRPTTDLVFGQPNDSWVSFEGSPGNPLRIFEHGVGQNRRVNELNGAILMKFDAAGGEPLFGPPRTDETEGKCIATTGAKYNQFDRHAIVWSPSTGAHFLDNPGGGARGILSKWIALGRDCSVVGVPTTDVGPSVSAFNGRFANFTLGTIVSGGFDPGGVFESHGETFTRWTFFNRENGFLGFPRSDVIDGPRGGVYQRFTTGSMYFHPDVNSPGFAADVDGPHDIRYNSLGGPSSFLGYPESPGTAGITDGPLFGGKNGTFTKFEHGFLVSNVGMNLPPMILRGKIAEKWFGEDDAEHQITGYPTMDQFPTGGGGVFQQFLNLHNPFPGAPHGTFMILNPLRGVGGTVYKVYGPVLECYGQGPRSDSRGHWEGPMSFPRSDVSFVPSENAYYGYFERGWDAVHQRSQGGVIGVIRFANSGPCEFFSTGM